MYFLHREMPVHVKLTLPRDDVRCVFSSTYMISCFFAILRTYASW